MTPWQIQNATDWELESELVTLDTQLNSLQKELAKAMENKHAVQGELQRRSGKHPELF